ncbi:hypothetical protein C5167_031485 [Papaver somniferum]|uniref:Uncharacterized protein n=1 Tax=Papaver somniferum TaxID=3469 RepID=A0A4Y7K8H4_PAPSO|nr:hypothetical protein C5167_031485 [Papaver somniferum]
MSSALTSKSATSIIEAVLRRDPNESEFIQSVQEAIHSLERVIAKNTHYVRILERLLEPERMLVFRVPWIDDKGESHTLKNALSPYKLGGAGGGSDFDPKGKSENEVYFAQLMLAEMNKELKGLRYLT